MTQILALCYEFLLIGLFAVGGGLATLPFLQRMSEAHPGWFTLEELSNMVAVSEATPGPLGINMATYVGYHVGGVPGALAASLSVVLPSIVLVLLISGFLAKVRGNRALDDAFAMLHPAVTGLIAAAGYAMLSMTVFSRTDTGIEPIWPAIALFLVFLAATQWPRLKRAHPVVFILAGAVMGVLLKL